MKTILQLLFLNIIFSCSSFAQNTNLEVIPDYPTHFFYDSLFNLKYEIKAKKAGIFNNGDIYLVIENEKDKPELKFFDKDGNEIKNKYNFIRKRNYFNTFIKNDKDFIALIAFSRHKFDDLDFNKTQKLNLLNGFNGTTFYQKICFETKNTIDTVFTYNGYNKRKYHKYKPYFNKNKSKNLEKLDETISIFHSFNKSLETKSNTLKTAFIFNKESKKFEKLNFSWNNNTKYYSQVFKHQNPFDKSNFYYVTKAYLPHSEKQYPIENFGNYKINQKLKANIIFDENCKKLFEAKANITFFDKNLIKLNHWNTNKASLVDLKGQQLFKPIYENLYLYCFKPKLLIAQKNNKFGLVTFKNEVLIDFYFNNLEDIENFLRNETNIEKLKKLNSNVNLKTINSYKLNQKHEQIKTKLKSNNFDLILEHGDYFKAIKNSDSKLIYNNIYTSNFKIPKLKYKIDKKKDEKFVLTNTKNDTLFTANFIKFVHNGFVIDDAIYNLKLEKKYDNCNGFYLCGNKNYFNSINLKYGTKNFFKVDKDLNIVNHQGEKSSFNEYQNYLAHLPKLEVFLSKRYVSNPQLFKNKINVSYKNKATTISLNGDTLKTYPLQKQFYRDELSRFDKFGNYILKRYEFVKNKNKTNLTYPSKTKEISTYKRNLEIEIFNYEGESLLKQKVLKAGNIINNKLVIQNKNFDYEVIDLQGNKKQNCDVVIYFFPKGYDKKNEKYYYKTLREKKIIDYYLLNEIDYSKIKGKTTFTENYFDGREILAFTQNNKIQLTKVDEQILINYEIAKQFSLNTFGNKVEFRFMKEKESSKLNLKEEKLFKREFYVERKN